MNMIDIVIAVYNPNKYLNEQIDSILSQTFVHKVARIIMIDDNSKDDRYIKENLNKDSRIEWHKNQTNRNGASANFSAGIELTTAEYVMTCDQDDVWLSNKIEISYTEIEGLKSRNAKGAPLLIATDVKVVDENLGIIENSFFEYRKTNLPTDTLIESLLFKNIVPGCTMMFNRALVDLAIPVSVEAMMHDWWLLLVAKLDGEVSILPVQTMLYRQHSNNCLGAQKRSPLSALKRRSLTKNFALAELHINNVMKQAGALLSQHKMSEDYNYLVQRIINFDSINRFHKIYFILRYFKTDVYKKVSYLLVSLF